MISQRNMIHETEWPWGLRCMDCKDELGEGDIYAERLTGITGDLDRPLFTVDVVCASCGLGLQEADG